MPRFLVVGATGQQGGAVIQALQASPSHSDVNIRAISRNTQSAAASKLKEQGIELFKADLTDPTSIEAALRGCDAAYLVTDFRGPGDVQGEIEQGKNFVDAAKRAGEISKHPTLIPPAKVTRSTYSPRRPPHSLLLRLRLPRPSRPALPQQAPNRVVSSRVRAELDCDPAGRFHGLDSAGWTGPCVFPGRHERCVW